MSAGLESTDAAVQAEVTKRQFEEASWANMCNGFNTSMAEPAWKYQYQAATQGHIPSMVDFAFAPALADYGFFNIFYSADKLGWSVYEHDASLMLRQAADSGNLRAISILTSALQGRKGLGERGILLAQPDKAEAAKYAFVYRMLASEKDAQNIDKRTLPELRKHLTVEELSRAEMEAKLMLSNIPGDYINKQLEQTEPRYGKGDRCAHD